MPCFSRSDLVLCLRRGISSDISLDACEDVVVFEGVRLSYLFAPVCRLKQYLQSWPTRHVPSISWRRRMAQDTLRKELSYYNAHRGDRPEIGWKERLASFGQNQALIVTHVGDA